MCIRDRSLTLSVVLFVTGNAFGGTLKGIAKELTVEADGDILFEAEEMPKEELLALHDRLKKVDGVSKSTWQADFLYSGTVEGLPDDFAGGRFQADCNIPIYVQFIEDAVYFEFIESLGFSVEEYSGQNAKVLGLMADTAAHQTFFTGQEMAFVLYASTGEGKRINATVVDHYPLDMLTYDTKPQYLFLMVVPWSMNRAFDGLEGTSKSGLTFWTDAPSQTMVRLQSEITDAGTACEYTPVSYTHLTLQTICSV